MSVDSVNGKTGDVVLTAADLDGTVRSIAGKTGVVTLTVSDIPDAAPKLSPSFTGEPTAPTPPVSDASSRIATTQFVHDVLGDSNGLVTSVNGHTGSVTLGVADINGAAPTKDPAFSGTPTAPTPTSTDKSNKLATTQFVNDATQGKANLDSPAFTGNPTAPTAAPGTNSGALATTAFVQSALAAISGGGGGSIVKYPTADTSAVSINFNQSSGDGWGVAHVRLAVATVSANGVSVGGTVKEFLLKVKSDSTTSVISTILDSANLAGTFTIDHFANRTDFTFKSNVQGGTHLWAVQVNGIANTSITSSVPGSTPAPTPSPSDPRPTVPDQSLYAPYSMNEDFGATVLNPNIWNKRTYNGTDNPTQNFSLVGGDLNLWPQKDGSGNWVERYIDTDGKFYFTYGFIEIEAQCAIGVGVKNILALMNHDTADTYYMAVMEAYPGGGSNSFWSDTNYHATNYRSGYVVSSEADSDTHWRKLNDYVGGQDLSNGFHKYGLHWDAAGVQVYFDGQALGPKIPTPHLTSRAYLSIQMAYGSFSGSPTDSTPTGVGNSFKINYVRVWPLASATNPAPSPTPTTQKIAYWGDTTIWGEDGASTGNRVATPMPVTFQNSLPASPSYSVVNEAQLSPTSVSKILNGQDGVHPTWSNYIANTDASIIIFEAGIADSYESGTTTTTFKNNLTQIIDYTLAKNKKIILQTANRTDDVPPNDFRQAILDVASAKGIQVIDVFNYTEQYMSQNNVGIYTICPNGYAPNQSFYNQIGQFAAQRFSQIMNGTAPAPTPAPGTGSSNGYIAPVGQSSSSYPVMCFNEEFDGNALNMSLWNTALWYEGDPGLNNYSVSNGLLNIWVKQQPDGSFLAHNRTVDTDGKYEQKYGYFEAEMKLPYGYGQWPAFWLYAHKDAAGNEAGIRPEIDIMEAYTGGGWDGGWSGHDANGNDNWHPNNYAGTCHDQNQEMIDGYKIGAEDKYNPLYSSTNQAGWPDLSAAFHVYGCSWNANGVQFYFDGKPFGNFINTSGSHTVPMYLLLDLWLGDNDHPYAGIPDSRTPQDPNRAFQIKYVRSWEMADGSTSIRGSYNMPRIAYDAAPTPSPTPTLPSHKVEWYGSSFVRGYDGGANGAQVEHPVTYYLQQKFPQITVVNQGVDSNTTVKLLNGTDGVHPDWATQMANSTADVVIIGSFGFQDSFDLTLTQWRDNLTNIYDIAHNHGKKVIFITVHRTDPAVSSANLADFASNMKDIADGNAAGFIEMLNYTASQFTGNIRDWVPDGYHPSQPGYTIIGQRVAEVYENVYSFLYNGIPAPAPSPTPTPAPVGNDPMPMGVPSSLVGPMSFREEFDGSSVSSTYWYPSMPNESENQYPDTPYANPDFSMQNFKVVDSTLKIWPEVNPSGRFFRKTFSTDGKFFQKYGIFEARMKMPRGRGCWPAFWLYSSEFNDPPLRPEIDIMEAYPGGGPQGGWGTSDLQANNYAGNVWMAPWNNGNQTNLGERKLDHFMSYRNLSDSFHRYSVVWDANGISFYFDGTKLGETLTGHDSVYRMYIVLDLWFGSASGVPNLNETPRGESNSFEIDYVYAWKLADGTSEISGTAPAYTPSTVQSPAPAPTPSPSSNIYPNGLGTNFNLTFNQEFSSTGAPDSGVWSSDLWYKSASPTLNYDVSGGNLRIWPALNSSNQFFDRTLTTDGGKFQQKYGFFEIRAQLPVGAGLHPVAGLTETNGTSIDFMHAYSGSPNGGWSNALLHPTDVVTNLWSNPSTTISETRARGYAGIPDLSLAMHTYGIWWDSTKVRFYLDGVQIGPDLPHNGALVNPLYFYIGLWISSDSEYPAKTGSGTLSTSNPYTPTGNVNSLLVDYIRAWQFA